VTSANPKRDLETLYQELVSRFGSEPKAQGQIAIWVRDFYTRFAADLLIGFFFAGKDLDLIAARQTEFLLRAMGARESYSGKAPASAHLEIAPILRGHFDRRLVIIRSALTEHGLTDAQISAWIGFEEVFRNVVEK